MGIPEYSSEIIQTSNQPKIILYQSHLKKCFYVPVLGTIVFLASGFDNTYERRSSEVYCLWDQSIFEGKHVSTYVLQ